MESSIRGVQNQTRQHPPWKRTLVSWDVFLGKHTLEKHSEVCQKPSHDSVHQKRREYSQIRERKRPPLRIIQGGSRNDRNPNARVYEERDPNWTDWCEEYARKAAWNRAKVLYKIRGPYQENRDTLSRPNF